MPPEAGPDLGPDLESVAEQVFIALADPTRRNILAALAAGGPATATDLADRLPITRQAIAKHLALLAEAGLVTAEPGERRRVRYRLRSAPMQVAQQFLAVLARDWDGPLVNHCAGTPEVSIIFLLAFRGLHNVPPGSETAEEGVNEGCLWRETMKSRGTGRRRML